MVRQVKQGRGEGGQEKGGVGGGQGRNFFDVTWGAHAGSPAKPRENIFPESTIFFYGNKGLLSYAF